MSDIIPMRGLPLVDHHIHEQARPLSESALWSLNERFFQQAGPEAWKRVPDYITTNPWNARIQADLVFGFLQDLAAEGKLDGDRPVTVIELASGTGRFAWHLHRMLAERLRDSRLADTQVRLVLTDLVDSNLQVARNHEHFAAAFDAGNVTAVAWDMKSDAPPVPIDGPLVLLANYLLDGVPQGAWVVADGLHELLMGIATPEGVDPDDPLLLDHISVHWDVRPAAHAPLHQPLLAYYTDHVEGAFTVPVTGLDLLERVRGWSPDSMVVVADKGVHHLQDVARQALPRIAHHGSISMSVNLHAMAWWQTHLGGHALSSWHEGQGLDTMVLVNGVDPICTRRAYRRWEDLDAATWSTMRRMLPHQGPFTPRQALALLRFTGHEPLTLGLVADSLVTAIEEGAVAPTSVAAALERVSEATYVTGHQDVDFDLGRLWAALGSHHRAVRHFSRSTTTSPGHASAWARLAACHHQLGEPDQARKAVLRALTLDPAHEGALAIRVRLDA